MIRSIIIDDEPQSRIALKDALEEVSPSVKIIAEANSVATAVEAIDNIHPDLIFLDIRLGDGSGFDVLEKTIFKDYRTIFLTAYNQYAVEAFRVNAFDYLLKPINQAHLTQAVHKAVAESPAAYKEQLHLLNNPVNNNTRKILFATSDGYDLYDIDSIIRCESDNNYCTIFFTGNEKLYVAKTMKELEEQLLKYEFERVHQSHLINIKHLKKYRNKDGGSIVLSNGDTVPVSQRKKAQVIDLLKHYSK